jgi:two-component system NtrC family sensor kinase
MIENKQEIIALLTGAKSAKRNYYTELKKNLRKIEKKNMQLEIINQVVKSFNVDMSMDDMLKNVMDKLQKIFSFDYLSLSMLDNGKLTISNVYPHTRMDIPPGTVLHQDDSLCWKAIHERKALLHTIVSSTEQKSHYIEERILPNFNITQMLIVPLFSKKRPIGVLNLGSTSSSTYNHSDLLFLQQLADQLAVCIENSQLYNAVLQSKREWERTFSAVADLLLYVDMDYRISRFNQAVCEFLDLTEDEIYGKKCDKLLRAQTHTWTPCPLTECYRTKQTAYQRLPLVGNRICDVFAYPVLNEENEMYGAILYIKDVTKKLHIEAQLIQSGKLAAIGEMAAGVAHELNNPLTAILGNTQLLLREKEEGELEQKLLHDILTCGKRCKNIIQNLLTFSRQEDYMFSECSLNDAVNQVLSLVRYQIERSNISFIVELEPDLPPIEGSIQQIEQIILNLLLNAKDAVNANENKPKCITIQTGQSRRKNKPVIYLHVKDNGCGIAEENKNEIFNPFFTTKEAQQGTGLGLSVSLGIARAHGGTLEMESEVGHGSCFTLTLPALIKEINDSEENIE